MSWGELRTNLASVVQLLDGVKAGAAGAQSSLKGVRAEAEGAVAASEGASSRISEATSKASSNIAGAVQQLTDQERNLNLLIYQLQQAIDNGIGPQTVELTAASQAILGASQDVTSAAGTLSGAAGSVTASAAQAGGAAQGVMSAAAQIGAAGADVEGTATSIAGPIQQMFNETLMGLIQSVLSGLISVDEAMAFAGSSMIDFQGKAQPVSMLLQSLLPTMGQVQSGFRDFLEEIEGHQNELDLIIGRLQSSSSAAAQHIAEIVRGILAGRGTVDDLVRALSQLRGTLGAGSDADIFGDRLAEILREAEATGTLPGGNR